MLADFLSAEQLYNFVSFFRLVLQDNVFKQKLVAAENYCNNLLSNLTDDKKLSLNKTRLCLESIFEEDFLEKSFETGIFFSTPTA